jgi:hypothetical protein
MGYLSGVLHSSWVFLWEWTKSPTLLSFHARMRSLQMSKRKKPGNGSRLRKTETFRATVNFDHETFQQVHALAEKSGVSLAEQTRQLVEFGLEAVEEGQNASGS